MPLLIISIVINQQSFLWKMEKLKFEFSVIPKPEDNKSNIYGVLSITDTENNSYIMPKEYQPINLHTELGKNKTFELVKNSIRKRHERRAVWIDLTSEMTKIYFDNGNMQFNNFLLEKVEQEIRSSKTNTDHKLRKQNKLKLAERFSIEKFSKSTTNVTQWLSIFVKECERLDLDTDIEKIEMLRLLLDDSCKDWYLSMLIKHTVESDWPIWAQSLKDTYADKGWSPIKYAFNFKYLKGSILDYALKKERLLLEVNSSINKSLLIDMIAVGLPNFITDKIDREKLKEVDDLFNKLRGLEHLIKENNSNKNVPLDNRSKLQKPGGTKEKTPCKTCESKGKKNRFHPENTCWYKNEKKENNEFTNTLLNLELSEEDPKN